MSITSHLSFIISLINVSAFLATFSIDLSIFANQTFYHLEIAEMINSRIISKPLTTFDSNCKFNFHNKIIRFNQCIPIIRKYSQSYHTHWTTSNFIVCMLIVALQSTIRNEYSMIVIFA